MNNFILSYNPFTLAPSPGQILNHVQVSRNVQQFYQPFAGTYIIKSDLTAFNLSESMKGLFENTPYLLVQFFPHLAGGTMPQDAWNWINHDFVPPAPDTRSLLNGLIEAAAKKP